MNRYFFLKLSICAILFAPAGATAAPIVVPAGLPQGAAYRLVFSTDSFTTAFSSDIADYNAFVAAAANSEPALVPLGTTWKALASTPTVAARDNTDTSPTSVSVPIYNLEGELVATSNDDLWDGTILTPIDYDQHGLPPAPGTKLVWTGSELNGTPNEPLGTDFPFWGQATLADFNWISSSHGTYMPDKLFALYGVSGVLTVVPEPGSKALAAAGAVAALIAGLRRRT
jgi:hypothetical protein